MDKNIKEKRDIIANVLGKVQMKDAGMKLPKPKKGLETCCYPGEENGVRYPTLYLDIKQAPDLSGYDVSDKITLILEGEIISHTADKNMSRDRENFEIKIKKIGCQK